MEVSKQLRIESPVLLSLPLPLPLIEATVSCLACCLRSVIELIEVACYLRSVIDLMVVACCLAAVMVREASWLSAAIDLHL